MTPFLLLLMSHVLGDGVLTSNRLAVLKRNSGLIDQIIAIGFHTGIHAFFAGLFLLMVGRDFLKAALLVFFLHFFIDFFRCRMEIRLFGPNRLFLTRSEVMTWIFGNNKDHLNIDKSKVWPWLVLNILDQGAHLASLYVISRVV
jgi:hypothetical protein